ncbi:MAG: hypothetical protein ABIQ90_01780 [Polaromonas sp.]
MNIRLLEPAQAEFDEAVGWYAKQAPGLGDAFLLETLKALKLIEQFPQARILARKTHQKITDCYFLYSCLRPYPLRYRPFYLAKRCCATAGCAHGWQCALAHIADLR